jgi:hypothetical protein
MELPDSNTPTNPSAPSIQVDSDWKAQAQAERERLAMQESTRAAKPGERDPEGYPPAEFRSLVGMLASQALMGLGTMGDEQGRLVVDLAGSKFAIDLLEVLQTKSKGNLTPEETKELEDLLRELKGRFMQVARLVTEQMARGQAVPALAPDAKAAPSSANKLIIP